MPNTQIYNLIKPAVATGAGVSVLNQQGRRNYQASGTTTSGTGAATIAVQGGNDGLSWDTIGTITLNLGAVLTSDSFASDDRYQFVRGNVTAISGSGASVNLTMGL